jgi:hypothetical protein
MPDVFFVSPAVERSVFDDDVHPLHADVKMFPKVSDPDHHDAYVFEITPAATSEYTGVDSVDHNGVMTTPVGPVIGDESGNTYVVGKLMMASPAYEIIMRGVGHVRFCAVAMAAHVAVVVVREPSEPLRATLSENNTIGVPVGRFVGRRDGDEDGAPVGAVDGAPVGSRVGCEVGRVVVGVAVKPLGSIHTHTRILE